MGGDGGIASSDGWRPETGGEPPRSGERGPAVGYYWDINVISLKPNASRHAAIQQKGIIMNGTEHSVQKVVKPVDGTGPLAVCRACLRGQSSGQSPVELGKRYLVLLGVLAALTAAVAMAVPAPSALAAGSEIEINQTEAVQIRATRAHLLTAMVTGAHPVNWRWEYSTEPGNPASWTVADSGVLEPGNSSSPRADLHKLKSGTHYSARIVAEGTGGHAEETIEFSTHAPEVPELTVAIATHLHDGEQVQDLGTAFVTYRAHVETNGAEAEYHFEYSAEPANPASWTPFTTSAAGKVSVAEDSAEREASLTGLTPETEYHVRATATNPVGEAEKQETSFSTLGTKPSGVYPGDTANDVTAVSAFLVGNFDTHSSEAHWRYEFAPAEEGHPPAEISPSWTAGPEGTLTAAEAAADAEAPSYIGPVQISGLMGATTYFVRLFVENAHGGVTSAPSVKFTTAGPPTADTFPVHALAPGSETPRILGSVAPHTEPVSELQRITLGGSPTGGTFTLSFKGQTTAPLPFDATRGQVLAALEALPSIGKEAIHIVSEAEGSPFTVEFATLAGGPLAGRDQPPITADASGLTPAGTVSVATLQDGFSYETHYQFQYLTEAQFKEDGESFSGATSTPEQQLEFKAGEGAQAQVVGQDLPGLTPGTAYRYRILASNTTPGNPAVQGTEQALTVPTPAPGEEPSCPNAALRTGPSAHLPDCRAYEQVTPAEKNGAQDTFTYSPGLHTTALVGEDGNHVLVVPQGAKWGSNPDPSNTSYFFAREQGTGWGMTSTTPPGAGGFSYRPEVFSLDLTHVALNASVAGSLEDTSHPLEFAAGIAGGPYATVASIPRAKNTSVREPHWVGASGDFSKLILSTEDRALAGHSPTKTGNDLYEYLEGELRQLNVTGPPPGAVIGSCGAKLASGAAEPGNHAVSADGLRVLFEAVPSGLACSEPTHLYVRVGGAETIDIGAYKLLAADPQDARLLLERKTGEAGEYFLYETGAQATTALFSTTIQGQPIVSEDLSTIYLRTTDGPLYRYDASIHALRFTGVEADQSGQGTANYVSPDGRYLYFGSRGVAGIPLTKNSQEQLYRYDSVENAIWCVSCASPFDLRPLQHAVAGQEGPFSTGSGSPKVSYASGNGDYAFFMTSSALLPSDFNGEIPPCQIGSTEAECGKEILGVSGAGDAPGTHDDTASRSTDVYEWRANGVDGCGHVQGCLALISSGGGDGFRNTLLGIAEEGRDVFFATHSQLAASDTDNAGDVYDARVGGGFPPPAPSPVECEGDACSTPFAPPSDVTPSSSTFQGAGNPLAGGLPGLKPKPAATKPKAKVKRCRAKAKKRCKANAKKPLRGKRATSKPRGKR